MNQQIPTLKTPKKKNIFIGCGLLFFIFILLVIILATCSGGSKDNNALPTKIETPTYSPTQVFYDITGTAKSVDVTLSNPTGGTEQYSKIPLPIRVQYNDFPGHYLYISAQNQGESGSVTVTIYINGNVFKTATSSGAYVIASASGLK